MVKRERVKMPRNGVDYDLVNIMLIGYDPVTGKSFEECCDTWKASRDAVTAEYEALTWWKPWHWWKLIRLRWEMVCLIEWYGGPEAVAPTRKLEGN